MRRGTLQYLDIHIGKRLKRLRKASKLSLATVGEIIEVSPQHLSRIERGERRLNAGQLYQLARGLDVPVFWFFIDYKERGDELQRLKAFLRNNVQSWHAGSDEELEYSLLTVWRQLPTRKQKESTLKIIECILFSN